MSSRLVGRLAGSVPLVMLLANSVAAIDASAPEAGVAGALVFEKTEHSFGSVPQGDAVAAEFAYQNRGPVPLTLSPPVTGCDCEVEIVGPVDLSPGDGGAIRFACDTSRMSGPVRLTATVHSSEVSRRAVLLTLQGEVELEVISRPTEVYLGPVRRGQLVRDVFTIVVGATGKRRVGIRAVETDGSYIEVGPGTAQGSFDVRVLAAAPLGVFTQTVSVATTSDRFADLTIPVTGIVVEELPARRW